MKSIDPSSEGSRRELVALLCVVAATLIIFTFALEQRDIVTSHEGRVAQTARIMAASGWPWNATPARVSGFVESNESDRLAPARLPGGRDAVNPWLFPVINDAIRLQKPPLPYWITAIIFKLFGVSEFNARIAPALLGAIATLLIWDIARQILGRRAALPAAIAWITMRFVVDEFRKSMADPYLAFFTLLAVWAWIRAKPQAAWIALALGALAKGPVIFVHVVPAIILARIFLRRPAGSVRWIVHVIGVTLFIVIVLPWPYLVLKQAPDVWRMWWYESGGEVSGLNVEKARPWWNYIVSSFVLALPWTPVWIAGIALAAMRARTRFRSPRNRRRMFAIAWFAIVLIFFSCLGVKKDAYLLPVMPAQALIIADAIVTMRAAWARRRANYEMSIVLAAAQCALGIGFGVGVIVALWKTNAQLLGMILCGIGVAIAIVAVAPIVRGRPSRWLIWQASAYALILVALLGFHTSATDNRRSPKRYAAVMAEFLRSSTNVPLLVSRLPEEASFYLPLGLHDDPNASRMLVLVDRGRKDPPVNAERLSNLLNGATIRSFQRVVLDADAYPDEGGDRYQLFDVVFDRGLASIMNVWEK